MRGVCKLCTSKLPTREWLRLFSGDCFVAGLAPVNFATPFQPLLWNRICIVVQRVRVPKYDDVRPPEVIMGTVVGPNMMA